MHYILKLRMQLGKAMLSCLMLAIECEGKNILTIEGMANQETGQLHPIQEAFVKYSGMQCGMCTPGMIVSAKALLDENPNPTEDDVREALAGNLCRCGNYKRITECVLAAAQTGKVITESLAEAAGKAVSGGTTPPSKNTY